MAGLSDQGIWGKKFWGREMMVCVCVFCGGRGKNLFPAIKRGPIGKEKKKMDSGKKILLFQFFPSMGFAVPTNIYRHFTYYVLFFLSFQ